MRGLARLAVVAAISSGLSMVMTVTYVTARGQLRNS